MPLALNYTAMIGRIGQYAPRRVTTSKTPRTSFTLCCTEIGFDGREHSSYVDCTVWGRLAEDAATLKPGEWVLMEGSVKPEKREEGWKLLISGHRIQRLDREEEE